MTQEALIRRLQISCFGLDRIDPLCLLVDDVIAALRENAMREVQRLGQEIEQEPCDMGEMCLGCSPRRADGSCPDAKPWVGLTDEEIMHCIDTHIGVPSQKYPLDISDWISFARAIDAKLKEKNT